MKGTMEDILILCIGDSNLIGDSLGPLIGSFMDRKVIEDNPSVKVIGTLENPIVYNDLIRITEHLNKRKQEYTTIITIDSALGSSQNIGKIIMDNSTLCAGNGVNSGQELISDISIRGIVGKNYEDAKRNIQELKNVSTDLVEDMACKIIFTILNMFKCWTSI